MYLTKLRQRGVGERIFRRRTFFYIMFIDELLQVLSFRLQQNIEQKSTHHSIIFLHKRLRRTVLACTLY